jgi:Zn-dependent M32 family carboxypeptidase
MAHVNTTRPDEAFQALEERLATISDVYSAASVLAWDRQTYMPEGGVRGRAAGCSWTGGARSRPRRRPSLAIM